MAILFKKIEHFLKNRFRYFVFKLNTNKVPIPVTEYNSQIANCRRILVLRQDRIGDLLVSVPFFKILKERLPHSSIEILLGFRNFSAKVCVAQYVDKVLVLPRNIFKSTIFIFKLRKRNYDLIIDLFDNSSFTSSLLINFLKPKFSLGFDKENRNVYTYVVTLPNKMQIHIVDRICNLLIPFGVNPFKIEKKLEYPIVKSNKLPLKTKPRVGIVIAGSTKSKYWGVKKIASLIEMLNDKFEFEIVLFGTKKYLAEISLLGKFQNTLIAPFTSDFDEFASMIASCDYLVSPDTSVVHLASAFQIPIVVFYTFVDNQFGMPWLPYKTKFREIISKVNGYSDIEPNQVFKGLMDLLN